MNTQETGTTITEIAPDTTLNLEQFLDDSFLQGEAVETTPIQLESCKSQRGATGHAWQS